MLTRVTQIITTAHSGLQSCKHRRIKKHWSVITHQTLGQHGCSQPVGSRGVPGLGRGHEDRGAKGTKEGGSTEGARIGAGWKHWVRCGLGMLSLPQPTRHLLGEHHELPQRVLGQGPSWKRISDIFLGHRTLPAHRKMRHFLHNVMPLMRKIEIIAWKWRREKMWVEKVGSAWQKIGRARLYTTVQQKPVGVLRFHGGEGHGLLGYGPVESGLLYESKSWPKSGQEWIGVFKPLPGVYE